MLKSLSESQDRTDSVCVADTVLILPGDIASIEIYRVCTSARTCLVFCRRPHILAYGSDPSDVFLGTVGYYGVYLPYLFREQFFLSVDFCQLAGRWKIPSAAVRWGDEPFLPAIILCRLSVCI